MIVRHAPADANGDGVSTPSSLDCHLSPSLPTRVEQVLSMVARRFAIVGPAAGRCDDRRGHEDGRPGRHRGSLRARVAPFRREPCSRGEAQADGLEATGGRGVLHLIGQLQSNKAKPAVALFDIIESVDRLSLIDALEKEAERRGELVSVLLQVNIAREPQKAGCAPESASQLMERLARSSWLRPRGLMTIAPLVADAEETRPVFSALRRLRDALQREQPAIDLETLSMGMSDDFRVAIEEGATSVRIGRAIFGHLAQHHPA